MNYKETGIDKQTSHNRQKQGVGRRLPCLKPQLWGPTHSLTGSSLSLCVYGIRVTSQKLEKSQGLSYLMNMRLKILVDFSVHILEWWCCSHKNLKNKLQSENKRLTTRRRWEGKENISSLLLISIVLKLLSMRVWMFVDTHFGRINV